MIIATIICAVLSITLLLIAAKIEHDGDEMMLMAGLLSVMLSIFFGAMAILGGLISILICLL